MSESSVINYYRCFFSSLYSIYSCFIQLQLFPLAILNASKVHLLVRTKCDGGLGMYDPSQDKL